MSPFQIDTRANAPRTSRTGHHLTGEVFSPECGVEPRSLSSRPAPSLKRLTSTWTDWPAWARPASSCESMFSGAPTGDEPSSVPAALGPRPALDPFHPTTDITGKVFTRPCLDGAVATPPALSVTVRGSGLGHTEARREARGPEHRSAWPRYARHAPPRSS